MNKQLGSGAEGGTDDAAKGHLEAHTLPLPGELDRALAEIAGAEPFDDQASLFLSAGDRLESSAETMNAKRKGAGRPLNSSNRRNSELFDLAMARGFKHPFIRLMEIVSADPSEICGDRDKAVSLQIRAAEALLPYDLAKKPQAIEIKKSELHVFMAGPLQVAGSGHVQGFSLTGTTEEYQQLSQVVQPAVAQPVVERIEQVKQDQ